MESVLTMAHVTILRMMASSAASAQTAFLAHRATAHVPAQLLASQTQRVQPQARAAWTHPSCPSSLFVCAHRHGLARCVNNVRL